MEMFLVFLGNGIVVGAIYALLAMGLSMTFSIMRIVNFAHGELYMVGAYMSWLVMTRVISNYWLAFLAAIVVGALLGFIIERLAFRPVYNAPHISMFIVSLGLVLILQEVIFINFTGLPQKMPAAFTGIRRIGAFAITDQRLLLLGLTLVIVVAIFIFFHRTKMGKALRAAAGNKLAASMVGININRASSFAYIGGTMLAAVAGSLLAPIFSVNPFMGGRLTGVAFIIVVAGGLGSVAGAGICGFALGIIESLFSGYVATMWTFTMSFVLLILVLSFKPMGLFGRD